MINKTYEVRVNFVVARVMIFMIFLLKDNVSNVRSWNLIVNKVVSTKIFNAVDILNIILKKKSYLISFFL